MVVHGDGQVAQEAGGPADATTSSIIYSVNPFNNEQLRYGNRTLTGVAYYWRPA